MGSVLKTDPSRNEVTISGRSRNDRPQKVVLSEKTTLVKQVNGNAADLKVGDTIEITGIPLQIDARTIRVGEPARQPEVRADRPRATPAPERPSRLPAARPRVLGRILRVSPLTVQLSEGINADIKVGGETQIVRITTVPFSSIKVGEPLFAVGSRDQNGNLLARRVQVGLEGFPGAGLRSAARPRPAKPPKK